MILRPFLSHAVNLRVSEQIHMPRLQCARQPANARQSKIRAVGGCEPRQFIYIQTFVPIFYIFLLGVVVERRLANREDPGSNPARSFF